MGESVLIAQLAREPVPGRVKTRLLPALGPERAAKLHAEMVCWTCRTLIDAGLGPVQLWVEGNAARAPFRTCVQWGAQGPLVQTGRDLGERMAHICVRGLAEHDAIILVGSDAPGIDRDFLVEARAALRRVDSDSGVRSETIGKASPFFRHVEAHGGATQRKMAEERGRFPAVAVESS